MTDVVVVIHDGDFGTDVSVFETLELANSYVLEGIVKPNWDLDYPIEESENPFCEYWEHDRDNWLKITEEKIMTSIEEAISA